MVTQKKDPKYFIRIDPEPDVEGKHKYQVFRDDYMFACGTATEDNINSLYFKKYNPIIIYRKL